MKDLRPDLRLDLKDLRPYTQQMAKEGRRKELNKGSN